MRLNSLVSIIIPYFNAEKYIEKTIESVITQSHSNLEIILINDGSSDDSFLITKSFKDPRISIFQQENKGVSAARNVGLDNINGDYICFLDADDTLPKRSIESRLKVFEENPEISFVDGRVDSFDEDMTNLVQTWTPSFTGNPMNDLIRLEGKSFLGLTWLIKTEVIGKTRFKENMTHAEDLLFLTLLAKKGGTYNFTKTSILNYRRQGKSAMSNLTGLEAGYRDLILELKYQCGLSKKETQFLKRKTRLIMFKSYLSQGEIGNALMTLFKNA